MKHLMHMAGRAKAMLALFALGAALLPASAAAGLHFAEFRGVPEHLGARSLLVDAEWFWAGLLLLAVVVSLWVFYWRDRSK